MTQPNELELSTAYACNYKSDFNDWIEDTREIERRRKIWDSARWRYLSSDRGKPTLKAVWPEGL